MSIKQEIQALSSSTKDLRSFGWTVGGAFIAFYFLLWKALPWAFGWDERNFPLLWQIGLALVVLGTIVPIVLKPIYYAWMSLAVVLGFVMTRVLLTIFFCLIIVPTGLAFRLFGYDPLHRKLDREGSTYWIEKKTLIDDHTRYEKYF